MSSGPTFLSNGCLCITDGVNIYMYMQLTQTETGIDSIDSENFAVHRPGLSLLLPKTSDKKKQMKIFVLLKIAFVYFTILLFNSICSQSLNNNIVPFD